MSELQHYYDNFREGSFMHPDPTRCGCGGRGWALSQVDTWHHCPTHYNGQRHPEDDHDECETPDTNEVLDARTIEAMAAVTPAVIDPDYIPF